MHEYIIPNIHLRNIGPAEEEVPVEPEEIYKVEEK